MGVSFTPETWEKLKDLRERHQRLARLADELRRLRAEGQATREDCERAEEAEREAYVAWQSTRVGPLGQERTVDPDHEVEEVPRDR